MRLARRATTAHHKLLTTPARQLPSSRHTPIQLTSYTTNTPYNFLNSCQQNALSGFKANRPLHTQSKSSPTLPKLQLSINDVPRDTQTFGEIPITLPTGITSKVHLKYTRNSLFFIDEDAQSAERFPVEQLRDACACPLCRDISSGQKSFSTTEIPTDLEIQNVRLSKDGGLVVTVGKDMSRIGGDKGHDILLDAETLSMLANIRLRNWHSSADHPHRFQVTYWDAPTVQQEVRKIDYRDFMQPNSTAFWDVIQDIMRLGIVFLSNVPRDENSVVHIAERINCIRETFYGRTFDVRAKPNAENVAYTSGYLGLHQDLLYLEPMPYIQVLHCMDNDCSGGESLFADADRVARILQNLPREDAKWEYLISRLSEVPIPYAYGKDGKNYHQERPVINNHPSRGFQSVRWSPPFQGKIHRPEYLSHWIAAARVFERAVNHESSMYQTKMAPGECVLFNNQRVLHGRTAFDAEGGSRWLRGTYLSWEDFWSTASYAPGTHAAARDDLGMWWRPEEANEELRGTRMAGLVKGWLEGEMKGLKD